MSKLSAAVALLALSACSSPKTPEQDADSASAEVIPPPPKTTYPAGANSSPAIGNAADHELTNGDCRALGDKYRSVTITDQEQKLQVELRPEQREQGEKAIADAADKLSTRWTDSCQRDLVGKFAPEEALKCAMAAKTVAAFDACLNAPPPPKK